MDRIKTIKIENFDPNLRTVSLPEGSTLGDGFIVTCRLDFESTQATFYEVKKGDKFFIAKVYRDSQHPNAGVHKALMDIDSPYVIKPIEVGFVGDLAYAILPSIGGEILSDIVDDGLIEKYRDRYISNINEGLRAIHEAGIYHRDINPSNIMITSSGDAMIVDFGIAVYSPSKIPVGIKGYRSNEGNPKYKSARGDERVSEKEDYYALGIMTLEIATRGRAFEGFISDELIHSSLLDEGVDRFISVSTIDRTLGTLISKLCHAAYEHKPFAYREVSNWCDYHDYYGLYKSETFNNCPIQIQDISYKGEFCNSTPEFCALLHKYWDDALYWISNHIVIIDAIREADFGVAEFIEKNLKEFKRDYESALTWLLLFLDPDSKSLRFRSRAINGFKEYLDFVVDDVTTNNGDNLESLPSNARVLKEFEKALYGNEGNKTVDFAIDKTSDIKDKKKRIIMLANYLSGFNFILGYDGNFISNITNVQSMFFSGSSPVRKLSFTLPDFVQYYKDCGNPSPSDLVLLNKLERAASTDYFTKNASLVLMFTGELSFAFKYRAIKRPLGIKDYVLYLHNSGKKDDAFVEFLLNDALKYLRLFDEKEEVLQKYEAALKSSGTSYVVTKLANALDPSTIVFPLGKRKISDIAELNGVFKDLKVEDIAAVCGELISGGYITEPFKQWLKAKGYGKVLATIEAELKTIGG